MKPKKSFTISAQRLRNFTTGIPHTKMDDIYEDLELITGETGLMTHMLPRRARSIEPWLHEHVTDSRFWDGAFDQNHVGEIELPIPTATDRREMLKLYFAQRNPLASKTVVHVEV